MKISRILSLLLVLLMIVSAVACGTVEETTTEEPTNAPTQEPTNEPSEAPSEAPSETPSEEPTEEPTDESESTTPAPEYDFITIAEALELCGEPGNITEERYYIRATVKTVTNPTYGAMVITDETGEISVYGTYSADGALRYNELDEIPYKGDTVILHCILQNYNGTKEVQNARLISFESNQGNIDVSEYPEATIAEARAAAEGEKVRVSGTVAKITYANGMKPCGFILVDGADSIYVYDGDAAGRVKEGNRIEIAASKTYWILADETYNAQTYGYKGCNQLENVTLISNDDGNNDWTSASLPVSTVKDILDTPVSEDITTQIFKVTAIVNKVPGSGFVNYYFNDLDEATGSYTYSQCNGGDFGWLDEFDGKICTVYLVVLNAKSSASGCVYRFLPVKVVDEGFTFDVNNAAEHAVKYYGVPQFEASYSGDPALELVSSVSSTLLGFENATLTYASSDESIISIANEDGKTIMHCHKSGTATVTVTGTYNGKTYSETVTISVDIPTEEIPAITVLEAIATENGTEVTVKGIVGPSLANQKGFYIIDNTGVIAVRTSVDTLATLEIGNEIIITGTKKLSKDTDGQIVIDSASLVQNNYGSYDYATDSFITGKTLADVIALDGAYSHTTEVYVITGTIKRESTAYSTNTFVVDGDASFMLYAGGPAQYKWLEAYVGQTLTIELAVCDWNAKGNKGCVLSITTEDGTRVLNEGNFQN